MGKFEGMLFCTDLDGTLYRNDKTVSKQNLDAIEYFKSEGGLFTFITGRPSIISKEICNVVKPNAPYGCFNGGGIFDAGENRYLWNAWLPSSAAEHVDEVAEQMPEMGIQLNTDKELYFYKDNFAMECFRKLTGCKNNYACYEDIKTEMVKIVFAHSDKEQIKELKKLLYSHKRADEFDFICSENTLYEILPKGTSKGNALCKLAELLKIDIKKTIAVGDYDNDVSMIKAAGIGFAVANAVDKAKEAADYITVSNEENAIAAIIYALDNGLQVYNNGKR